MCGSTRDPAIRSQPDSGPNWRRFETRSAGVSDLLAMPRRFLGVSVPPRREACVAIESDDGQCVSRRIAGVMASTLCSVPGHSISSTRVAPISSNRAIVSAISPGEPVIGTPKPAASAVCSPVGSTNTPIDRPSVCGSRSTLLHASSSRASIGANHSGMLLSVAKALQMSAYRAARRIVRFPWAPNINGIAPGRGPRGRISRERAW
jgi:hypothetical protein